MVIQLRPEVLEPESLRQLLGICRVVDLGLREEQFINMVALQERMKETGYTGLTMEELGMCSCLWQRLHSYINQGKPGYEHLVEFFKEKDIW